MAKTREAEWQEWRIREMEKREVPQVASQRVYRMSAPEPRASAPPASGSATGAPMRAPRRSCRRPAPAAQSQHIQEEQLRAALAGDATRVQAQLTRAAKLRRGKSQLSLAALNTLCDLSDKLDGYEMQVRLSALSHFHWLTLTLALSLFLSHSHTVSNLLSCSVSLLHCLNRTLVTQSLCL